MELSSFVSATLQVFQSEKQLKAALAEQEALAREMRLSLDLVAR